MLNTRALIFSSMLGTVVFAHILLPLPLCCPVDNPEQQKVGALPEAEDLEWFGALDQYNDAYDKVKDESCSRWALDGVVGWMMAADERGCAPLHHTRESR